MAWNRLQPIPGKSIAYNFLYTLHGKEPDPETVRALDVALILHADHELNASTFAARVTAATMSDIYSSVTSAIGALKGPLHGGANEEVKRMLEEIGEPRQGGGVGTRCPRAQSQSARLRPPRLSHRRPARRRVAPLRARSFPQRPGNTRLFEISCEVERVMRANSKVYPNVDFYSATAYSMMGIPPELFTPIFAVSRTVGWTAHILEQWANNRIIRPRALYTGPADLHVVPIDERHV